jgi:hypothetical protein
VRALHRRKNITGMVIIRASARDYLCLRHQQWLRGIHRPALAALPEVTESQRRHDNRTASIPDQDIARAHRQARDITGQWLANGWHPALTERWQARHRRLAAATGEPDIVLAEVITHPEMLAVARLLISGHRSPGIRPQEITARLGFSYPSSPHPLDPLQNHLFQLASTTGSARLIRTAHGPFAVRLPAEDACGGGTVEQGVPRLALEAGGVTDGHRRGEPRRHGEARLGGSDVGSTQ